MIDYALPPRCPGCGAIVEGDDRFCQTCWGGMTFLADPCCARCGVPFEIDLGEGACCGPCLADPPPWDSARAALSYGDAARTVALRLKYGRRTGAARLMARMMLPRVPEALRQAGDEALIVPVPLHRWRLWGRGFNQSQLIAHHMGRVLSLPVDPFVLRRVKATRPMRDLSHRQRERTVKGAFALYPARVPDVSGKIILLIDDIHTSGATARACTKILFKGGAASVHLLCWARVLGDEPAQADD
jgi:ComF family protein